MRRFSKRDQHHLSSAMPILTADFTLYNIISIMAAPTEEMQQLAVDDAVPKQDKPKKEKKPKADKPKAEKPKPGAFTMPKTHLNTDQRI